MPFGEKEDIGGEIIRFDEIYEYFIKPILKDDLKLNCIRCDEIAKSGWIHSRMIEHIYKSDICLVDITSLNPNVFYELGVRHALAESITVIIRRGGTKAPFNIQGFNIIEYNEKDLKSIREAEKKIVDFVQNGLSISKKTASWMRYRPKNRNGSQEVKQN